jgi:hypothetical protein
MCSNSISVAADPRGVSESKLHHHYINMENGLIFGVVTETCHSLSEGKKEAALWKYNMSVLRPNMTDCALRHC